MFVGTSRNLTVKGYDEYFNPVELDESKLQFTVEGVEGEFVETNSKPYLKEMLK